MDPALVEVERRDVTDEAREPLAAPAAVSARIAALMLGFVGLGLRCAWTVVAPDGAPWPSQGGALVLAALALPMALVVLAGHLAALLERPLARLDPAGRAQRAVFRGIAAAWLAWTLALVATVLRAPEGAASFVLTAQLAVLALAGTLASGLWALVGFELDDTSSRSAPSSTTTTLLAPREDGVARCPVCRDPAPTDDVARACARPGCGARYHPECWAECARVYGACAVFACGSQEARPARVAPARVVDHLRT